MLILKAFVNREQIDEIHIQNTSKTTNGVTEYRIKKPAGYENIPIYHIREAGWKVLAEKVIYALNNARS